MNLAVGSLRNTAGRTTKRRVLVARKTDAADDYV